MTDANSVKTTDSGVRGDSTVLSDMTHADLGKLEAYYDKWSASYEDDLLSKGYNAPEMAAEALHRHDLDRALPVLDAGCGTGLTGLHLKKRGFGEVVGVDYSMASLEKAREKECYSDLRRMNLNEPMEFPDDHFVAAQCIGALTYMKNMDMLMREFRRVVRPGGIVSFTHRVDLYDDGFRAILSTMEDEGLWTGIHRSEPMPYIPGHNDFGDDKAIIYDMFRVNAAA